MRIVKEIRLSRSEERVVSSTPTVNGGWVEKKQVTNISTVGVIRTNTYAKSFEHICKLVEVAKTDFPYLQDKDIEVVHYGGDRYGGTYGIEFPLPDMEEPPAGYSPIRELELTR